MGNNSGKPQSQFCSNVAVLRVDVWRRGIPEREKWLKNIKFPKPKKHESPDCTLYKILNTCARPIIITFKIFDNKFNILKAFEKRSGDTQRDEPQSESGHLINLASLEKMERETLMANTFHSGVIPTATVNHDLTVQRC